MDPKKQSTAPRRVWRMTADAPQGEASAPNEKQPLSPRDFINKRMAELDKKKGG